MPNAHLQKGGPAALAAAAALAAYAGLTAPAPPVSQRFVPSEHPAAVLAWVTMRCDAHLALKPGAPRAHPEVLLDVAAAYDQAIRHRPISAVCAEAAALARSVADDRSVPPSDRVAAR